MLEDGIKRKSVLILVLGLLLTLTSAVIVSAKNNNYVAHLSSGQEVMPAGVVNDSQGQGQAIFKLSADGLTLHYKLIVANIYNVTASHIHIAPAGVNGGVVAFLFGSVPAGGGRTDGVLAEGDITAANLVGTLAGHPLSDLIAAMDAGNAYVNVHTNDGVAPTNTGSGDFPGGEIRGQIH